MASPNASTRSLLEIALGFLGALLIVPLLIQIVFGVGRGAIRLIVGLFKFRTTRRLIGDAVFAGLTALLTREDVLDALFGRKGKKGDGFLKPRA